MATICDLPHEVLSAICSAVYDSAFATYAQPLDPLLSQNCEPLVAQPSTYPPSNWSEPLSRTTLKNLCLVSHDWFNAAKPYLWRNVEIRLPRTWLSFVEEVGMVDNEEEVDRLVSTSVHQAATAALAIKSDPYHSTAFLHQSILAQLSGVPHNSVPPELLSPPASRDPSPARLRAKSPGRWRFLRAVSDAAQELEPGVYVPTPEDPRPGRHVRHLDFNHFRTIGMRRSVGEGVNSRFVTADRVQHVLKEMPHLVEFGATEYMDGAMGKSVLVELFLRGRALSYSLRQGKANGSRGRGIKDGSDGTHNPVDYDDDVERRLECKDLEAIDLCGCVSSVFVQALTEFVGEYLQDAIAEDGTIQSSSLIFPGLKRLGMRGVTSVPQHILAPFVLACTSLTHLDLSGTRAGPELLEALEDSTTVRLTSLSLGRCVRLTADSIVDFLVDGLPARSLRQLSLYGDGTFISPLSEVNLLRLVTEAPCFTSGALEYLDLSSSPLTPEVLRLFPSQPSLRSLGLSYIPLLPLRAVSSFVLEKAPNVEVLALIGTSPELGHIVPWRQLSMSLHSCIINPLATAPFKFSLSTTPVVSLPPTRVRVIELGLGTLNALGAGAGAWRVIKSKGGRGWYVDSSSGWVNGELRRNLAVDHPIRKEFERLALSNGNVSSGVGWHARKMEVLHGDGMLGREDGLYGAVSFAYQG